MTDDENEWRTAEWRTCKASRALADSWRQRKSVSGTGARRRGQQISADLVQVREKISIDERKRDAAARLCLDGTDVLNKDRIIAALSKTSVSGFVTTSSEEASLLIWSRQGCRSEETQFPIATPAICGPPQKAGELRPMQGSHNTGGKECLLLGHKTGISLTLLRDVSSDGVRPCQHVLLSQHRSHRNFQQRRSPTNSIMVMGGRESKFHLLFNMLVRITRSCHCPRHLNLKVMGRFGLSWHVLSGHSV